MILSCKSLADILRHAVTAKMGANSDGASTCMEKHQILSIPPGWIGGKDRV
jgi:hypothetical protein